MTLAKIDFAAIEKRVLAHTSSEETDTMTHDHLYGHTHVSGGNHDHFIPPAPAKPTALTLETASKILLILFLITVVILQCLTIKQLAAKPMEKSGAWTSKHFNEFTKWQRVRERALMPAMLLELLDQKNIVESDRADQIKYVDAIINDIIEFKHEPEGRDDWQTPQASMELQTGDCEDFAIAKFYALKHLGINSHLLMVWDVTRQDYHMVLETDDGVLLDNNKTPARADLLYVRIYALTESMWKQYAQK